MQVGQQAIDVDQGRSRRRLACGSRAITLGIGAEERLAIGTGLSLADAQSLVEAQGGRIWVESTPVEGTGFRLALPLVQKTGNQHP
jgi:signal transduction histidine kinase